MKKMEKRQDLYYSIKKYRDENTRNRIYRQFIFKYYPEASDIVALYHTQDKGDEKNE